jgi:hypothetical protein
LMENQKKRPADKRRSRGELKVSWGEKGLSCG